MNDSEFKAKSVELNDEIFEKDYYSQRYLACLSKRQLNATDIANYDKSTLVLLWNDFWFSLPDSSHIRTETFFKLCDLAEEIMEDDSEEYDDSIPF